MDITYVTNSELGFDYLRDNLAAVRGKCEGECGAMWGECEGRTGH